MNGFGSEWSGKKVIKGFGYKDGPSAASSGITGGLQLTQLRNVIASRRAGDAESATRALTRTPGAGFAKTVESITKAAGRSENRRDASRRGGKGLPWY